MTDSTPQTDAPLEPLRPWAGSWRSVLILVLVVTAARLIYLAWLSPFALGEDEAHYWEWARRLDWSYYSKGPGIAWTIALTTALLGDTELGVRVAAPIFGGLTALVAAGIARLVASDRRAGFYAAAMVLLIPAFQVVAILMTIDGPYLASWAVATLGAVLALRRGSRIGWLILGGALAVGFLYKYTILLLVPGLVVYAIVDRAHLRLAPRVWVWMLAGIALFGLGLLPVVIWNAQHHWPTLAHLAGHLNLPGGDTQVFRELRPGRPYSPGWTLGYIFLQPAITGPVMILAIMAAVHARRSRSIEPARASDASLLVWTALPIFVFYFFVSFFTDIEANWTMAGYLPLAILSATILPRGLDTRFARLRAWKTIPKAARAEPQPRTALQVLWHVALGYGLVPGLVMPRLDLLTWIPILGPMLPVSRLTLGPRLAGAVEAELVTLRERETARATPAGEPIVITDHYGRASLLAFYLPGQPTVYCASAALPALPAHDLYPGRRNQYDFWAETDLGDLGVLAHRHAVLVGGSNLQWESAFRRVEALPETNRKDRPSWIGLNYQGFPPPGTILDDDAQDDSGS